MDVVRRWLERVLLLVAVVDLVVGTTYVALTAERCVYTDYAPVCEHWTDT